MYWPSFQSLKTSELWKKLDKKMKWTYMGMWSAEDSQMHSDNPEYKLEPNMAYLNKRKAGFKPRTSRQDEESEN
jgi:hypothetical protein